MLEHKVTIAIDEQVAVTKVEQTFRNHTDRRLEATYVFPVPKGAGVTEFVMWVDGKKVKGELVPADKAREIYTSIVRRTQDPGLLEYMGNNLLRMKVFPIPPKSDQKVAFSYTSENPKEAGLIEYVYPLKTDGKATATLKTFSIKATIKSEHGVQNVYSPTHALTVKRNTDKEFVIDFERDQGLLDKDFQLFYATGGKDVGLTAMTHRPVASEHGYFMLLVTPKVEMSKKYEVPRDIVMVLDTSGSMRGVKMEQAKKALKYCLNNLGSKDRFALMNFATTVNKYKDGLLENTSDQLEQARKWVDSLEATGGTAINDALAQAIDMRTKDEGRTFTIVFFTDGEPTIGETNPSKILKNVFGKNTANTRIFTFGVGDDVNATFLDQLAEGTRAVATYVRPAEDIEAKVSSLHAKISHPVLTNLKLTATNGISFSEMYPAQLPDLFHGQQLTVLGRFTGKGSSAIRLTGMVGMETKEFAYDFKFADKTNDDKAFVEQIWARRKVGYLLDQIRANGAKKELVDEVVALAKKYGITTPYTSYLIVPDAPMPVAQRGNNNGNNGGAFGFNGGFGNGSDRGGFGGGIASGLKPTKPEAKPQSVASYARTVNGAPGGQAEARFKFEGKKYDKLKDSDGKALRDAGEKLNAYELARRSLGQGKQSEVQSGKLGVDLSCQTWNLRNQTRLEYRAQRNVAGRNCMEVGGVWIDEGFTDKTKFVAVKAQSDAYFRILERHKKVKEVFQLGNYLVWVTPSGTALVIDTSEGKEKLTDEEIDKLFVAKK
jgi:Ca-activated chloride channel family protein